MPLFFCPILRTLSFVLLSISIISCRSTSLKSTEGIVFLKTQFFDSLGKSRFINIIKIWYKDSLVIEKINRTTIITYAGNQPTFSYSLLAFRYIDLPGNTWHDYNTFSDTAKQIKHGILPDSVFKDYGWCFYSNKTLQIQGQPQLLTDTIIDNTVYKRAKFSFLRQHPEKYFAIGYFRCDNKPAMFSLEKSFSRQLNCVLVKILNYQNGKPVPYASMEVGFISDKLTHEERKVFEVWQLNAKSNPVFK